MKKIITSTQREIQLDLSDPIVAEFFDNPEKNQTDFLLDQINNTRLYDPVMSNKTDLTILDFGANFGVFSLYAMDSAKKIYAYEPTPYTFDILVKITAGYDNIVPIAQALSDHDGTIDFFVSENPTINSLDPDAIDLRTPGVRTTVEARTLETIFKEQNLDFVDIVKCDIEGSEMIAITDQTLDPVKDRIGFWYFEIHQTNRKKAAWPGNLENNRQQIAGVLKNAGFGVESVINDILVAWK
jgi:FkbM family methyltransferase